MIYNIKNELYINKFKNIKKILVCGSRNYNEKDTIYNILNLINFKYLIEGGCIGADLIAKKYCIEKNKKYIEIKANWNLGKKAGPIRNNEMIKLEPNLVIAFSNDIKSSKGTKNMVNLSLKKNIKTLLISNKKIYCVIK